MSERKALQILLVVAAAVVLSACGGGGGGGGNDAPLVAAADLTVRVSSTVTGAVVNTPFAFPSGVTSFADHVGNHGRLRRHLRHGGVRHFVGRQHCCNWHDDLRFVHLHDHLIDLRRAVAFGWGQYHHGQPLQHHHQHQGSVRRRCGSVRAAWRSSWVRRPRRARPTTVSVTPRGQVTLNGAIVGAVALAGWHRRRWRILICASSACRGNFSRPFPAHHLNG